MLKLVSASILGFWIGMITILIVLVTCLPGVKHNTFTYKELNLDQAVISGGLKIPGLTLQPLD